MSEHRDDPTQPDEDSLLRRWYAASSRTEPLPAAELLERADRIRGTRRRRQNFAVAAVAVVAVIAGIVGVGAWANFRAVSAPAGPSATTSTPTAAETPSATLKAPSGFALGDHESILQIHRTTGGGWLLTDSRLLVTDGSSWRDCWKSTGVFNAPYPYAIVAGKTVRVFAGGTMWTSTDGCASWAHTPTPVLVMSASFPTATTGYIAYVDMSTQNATPQIFRTEDAGAHWTATRGKVPGYVGTGLLMLAFADADRGWLTDGYSHLWTTADGGGTWKRTTLPVPASVRGKFDSLTAPIVDPDGSAVVTAKYDTTPGMDGAKGQRVIYRTVDGGAHWTVSSVLDDPGTVMLSLDDPTAWVALDPSNPATVRTSTDGGASWQTTPVRERWPFTASWFMSGSMSFADSSHGWMVVQEPPPPCTPSPPPTNTTVICDYAFSPPQHLVATDDGGATWHQIGS
jgi:photosystem II stability/assembly factor-like uncharacterized protein